MPAALHGVGRSFPHSLSPQAGDATAEQVNRRCLATGDTMAIGFAALGAAKSKLIQLPTGPHEYSTLW